LSRSNAIAPFVSVVIPAYNEESRIGKCLESVIATRYSNMEIIVVDDCSTDRTSEVASKYSTRVIRRQNRGGAAIARNDGLQAGQGEIVAFVDGDCTVEKAWLDLLTSHYGDEKVAGAGGIISTQQSSLFAKYRNYIAREDYTNSPNPVAADDIPGGNSTYRIDVLRRVGGFDPAFAQPRAHETYELGHRIIRNGYLLIGDPRAVVYHSREGSFRSWVSEAYADGYAALSFLRGYKFGEFLGAQLRQMAFLAFLITCAVTLVGLIPPVLVLGVAAIALAFETMRAAWDSGKAALHYRNAKYFVMIPIELVLRAVLYFGYLAALVTSVRRGAARLTDRFLRGKGGDSTPSVSGTHQQP
jgi:glycosyltransferase involved in cell wall biosynthesis